MKTKLLTLLVAMFVFAESAKADFDFTHFSINFYAQHLTHRDNYDFSFSKTGAEDVKIEEPVTSLEVTQIYVDYNRPECKYEEQLSKLKFWYTVYNTQDGGPSENSVWKSIDFHVNESGIIPTSYIHQEISKGEWLRHDTPKTIMFYVEGKDRMGNTRSYNNGGENYKLNFTVAKSDNIIKFCEEDLTPGLRFRYYVNREEWHGAKIYFNDDGSFSTNDNDGVMPAPDDFGKISSLFLYETHIIFDCAEDLGLNDTDASFWYKVYEEGHGNDVDWNKLDLDEYYNTHDKHIHASISDFDGNPSINLTEGLELNKNYVFEVYYQVIADEKCYTLGKKENEGTKFKFTTRTAQIIEGPIKSMMLAYSLGNNDVVYQEMPESEFPEVILQEPISSFKIYGGEAVTDDRIQNLELLTTVIEEDNQDNNVWQVIPFTDNGFGMWTIELPEPRELMRERWLDEHKRITYVLTVEGTDQNGNPVTLDNGGEGYKFTFTCCPDTARGIKDFRLRVDANGEEGPLDMPVSGAEWAQIPLPLYSFKILKAEANTYKPMKSVTFFYTLFNTADGVSFDQDAWMTSDLVHQGNNYWAIDIYKELIDEEWLLQNLKTNKTFQFFLRAEDEEGNEYFYNNDDKFYIFSFNLDDADGINEIESGNLKVEKEETIFNLAGQRLQKPQKGINIIGGKKMLVK